MFRSFKIRTRRDFEGYIVDATGAAMLVGGVGMFVEVGIKQACRPPLIISLPSIALQHINKADGLLPAFCRRARTILRLGMSEDGTQSCQELT